MAQKKKTIGEKLADVAHSIGDSVDHALHPDQQSDVESNEEVADESVQDEDQEPISEGPHVELGITGNDSYDHEADQDHSKFDKFK